MVCLLPYLQIESRTGKINKNHKGYTGRSMADGKSKILLVRPDSFSIRGILAFNWPPLTLLQIAAVTPDKYSVKIVDESFEKVNFNVDADLVGLSFRTLNAPRGYWIADEFRKRGIPVVIGGWHASALPHEAKEHADAVFIGEAEGGWKQLLRDFEKDSLKPFYRAEPVEGELIPEPRIGAFHGDTFVYTIQATRGCPYGCEYCSISNSPLGGRRYRARPVENVVRELEKVKEKIVIFVDPSLGINTSYTKELFKRLSDMNKKFACFINIKAAFDEEFLKLASDAGFFAFSIGFETFSEGSMEKMKKLPRMVKDYKDAVKKIHDHGIAVLGSFVFGFDDDKKDIFERSIDLMKYIEIDSAGVNILTPFPGTPLFDRLEKENRILTKDWSRYNMKDVVFIPKHMTPEELKGGAADVAKEFFSWKSTLSRFMLSIRYGLLPSISSAYWSVVQRTSLRKIWKWF